MVDAEEYFPRGGKKPTTTYFRQNDNFLGAPEKAEKKKRRQKKKSEGDDGYLSDDFTEEFDQSYKTCGIFLNYKVVKEGLLLLGRVRQVFETKINVSLPCRMHGSVMACHISEAYNNLLEAYVNDKVEQVRELPQMFRPGQYVALKVLEVSQNSLTLSMMPQHINADRKSTDLHKGALLQAAVSSIEDHGYVMDIGIPDTRAFLAKKTCNPEVELDIGVTTWVTIKSLSADCKVVTLSSELGALQRSFQRNSGIIYPGTAVDFTVHKALDNGIEGHILNNRLAYIQRHQVDTVKGKKPALGQKIRARLLYSVPPHHTPFLTMRGVFDSMIPTLGQEQIHQDGDIIEEAQVLKTWGHSVLLRLSARSSGVLTSRRGRHDSTDDYDITKAYPIGSTHRVRVLCYNLSDYVYSLSDDPAVVRLRHFKLSQLRVGELVPGTLSEVSDGHLRVAVGRLSGYVPRAHMTETGVFVDPKKASNSKLSRKYKVGQEVQARVLAIDEAKNSLVLTLKPSLLAPDLPLLMDYSERHIGKMYTGVISHIKNYLLVSFFNNVVVYVPGRLVGSQPGDLTHAFHIGQIVKCTILSVTPEAEKMSGSLTSEPFDPSEKAIKKAVKRKNAGVAKEQSESNGTDDENNEDHKNGSDPDVRQVQSDETSQKKKRKKTEDKTADLNEDAENSETPMDIDKNEKTDIKSRKKKKKDKSDVKDDITEAAEKYTKASKNKVNNVDQRDENNTGIKEGSKKNKKLKNKQLSEESDIQDDRDVLTPQEQSLVDLSDCDTEKLCKKRIVSLLKAINARTQRISRVEKKMASKESRGLTRKNKKFHTAMNLEKLNNEDRIKKFFKVIEKAQEKLKEFQKASELEKAMKLKGDLRAKIEAKRKEKKDKENEGMKNSEKEVEKVKGPNKLEFKEELKKVEASKLDKTKEITKAANVVEQKQKENKLNKEQNKVNGNERSKTRQKPDIVKIKPLEPVLEVPSAKEFWSIEEKKIEVVKDDSSSSDEEEEEKPKKKRKKLSPAEKAAKAREEEERLREIEKRAIESENSPRSSEQFERALLAQPNCSQLWIAYMAFHLQSTEIEKARSVARKALNTINFREEGEKLNMWLALLNLEHRFGAKETQQKTLEEALQMNDTYSVHSKVLDILVETSKQQELAALVELMMRRYKTLEAYNACGAACYRAGLVDKARHVMQKGMLVLEKKEHVSLVVKFAVMERARAVPEGRERSEALLEQLLATYPQRVDVVAVYCDMLFKDGDIQRVRQLMGRMTSLNLPARKMKVLFKKWIEIEQKIGDDEHAENVRQSAMKFLDKAKF